MQAMFAAQIEHNLPAAEIALFQHLYLQSPSEPFAIIYISYYRWNFYQHNWN